MKERLKFGQRFHNWLDEPEGQIFAHGKWRFWFPMLLIFSVLNPVLTASIFGSAGKLQGYFGAIMLSVGALLAWLCVGTLHYSDSRDARLARGVSILDSFTLCFVIAHFCFLLWAQGHLLTLQSQEAKYEASAVTYNERAERISGDNVRIAEAVSKAERLRNDTAYQLRRAAETGNLKRARAGRGPLDQSSSLSTSPIELAKPEKPEESSAAFLTRWDAWIRMANFGELILAAVTLIYIRNRSAKFNHTAGVRADAPPHAYGFQMTEAGASAFQALPEEERETIESTYAPDEAGEVVEQDDDFPSELDASDREAQRNPALRQQRQSGAKIATTVALSAADERLPAFSVLRHHLRVIAFHHPNRWFKCDLIDGGVWIRMCERRAGREVTIAKTRQSNKLFAAVNRPDFRARLVDELIYQGFPIEKEKIRSTTPPTMR
ncbi:MAG TPA: hypothetical protein VE715_09490 [Blastocatellia bacterium]|nr:hypothetical protein [Blastocatellia bacterium]